MLPCRYVHYFESLLRRIKEGRVSFWPSTNPVERICSVVHIDCICAPLRVVHRQHKIVTRSGLDDQDESYRETKSPAVALLKVKMLPAPLKTEDTAHVMSIFVIEEENAQPVPMYHTGGVKCADGLWEHHIAQTEGSSNSSAHNFADQGDVVLGMEAGSSPVSQMSEPSSPGGQPPSNRSGQRVAAKLKQGNSLLSKLREGSFREASRSFPRNEEAGGLRLAGDIRLEMSAKTYFGSDKVFSFQIHSVRPTWTR